MNKIFFAFAQREGLSLFPCCAGTKVPTVKWTAESSLEIAQWEAWQSAGYNLAINAARSGLLIVDIDASRVGRDAAWTAWDALCKEWGLPAALMPMTQSARGGWHVMVRRPSEIDPATLSGTKILVKISDTRKLADDEKDSEIVAVKNRGYCVAPGSYLSTDSDKPLPYLMMVDVPPPHDCPDALIEALKLPKVDIQTTGKGGEAETADVAAVIAALDAVGEFDSEPEWFKALGAIKLALGDTEQAIEVAKQITWGEVTDKEFLSKWQRLSTEPRPNDYKIASLIKRAEEVTGKKFSVRKSIGAMFGGVETASPSIVSAAPVKKLVLTSAEFVAGFEPPEYVLDGILQRGFCYSLTAQTGAGKTAIALRLGMHIALGLRLGERDAQQGSVLYFASENHIDVQARWLAMAEHCGFNLAATNVHFVIGATRLSEIAERIAQEVANGITDLALVIVDTSAATFEGEDENSNVHAIEHAKRMRSLTALPGRPTVLVLCHPTKRAGGDDLIPRGGGAFLAEVDGNLCARKSDSLVELHWAGKYRGMDFTPMNFELSTVTAARLKDRRGRSIPTVLAKPLDEAARKAMAATGRKDEDQVLRAIEGNPEASLNDIAKALDWTMRDGKPYIMKVKRATDKLAADLLIHRHRDAWALTPKGQKELNAMNMKANRTDKLTPITGVQNTAVMDASIFQGAKPN